MKVCFLITSVINTYPGNLLYGPRSYYSPIERYEQTILTISTIKKNFTNIDIIFIEASVINNDMEVNIKKLVNYYINISDIDDIKLGTNSVLKGYGETMHILYALDYLKLNNYEYEYIIKISGRYFLSDNFELNKFIDNHNKITFCRGKYIKENDIVSTVLIGIPYICIQQIYQSLIKLKEDYINYEKNNNYTINTLPFYEKLLPKYIEDYCLINNCGVKGLISSYNEFYEC